MKIYTAFIWTINGFQPSSLVPIPQAEVMYIFKIQRIDNPGRLGGQLLIWAQDMILGSWDRAQSGLQLHAQWGVSLAILFPSVSPPARSLSL